MRDFELDCKGLVYRARVDSFLKRGGEYVDRRGLTLLVRKSCRTCEECLSLLDMFKDYINEGHCVNTNHLEDMSAYRLTITNIIKDWELGVVIDYNIEFIKVEE